MLRESLVHRGEEAVCSICRDAGWVRHTDDPAHPQFGKLFPCSCLLEQFDAARGDREARISRATLPKGALRQTFATFDANVAFDPLRAAVKWANGDDVPWLNLYGGTGNGKTHLAFAAAHELIGRGYRVEYQNVVSMLNAFRSHYAAERRVELAIQQGRDEIPIESFDRRFRDILTTDYLILDDFGAQRQTGWAEDTLYDIVDSRYRDELPLLVITNVPDKELPVRIVSRLQDKGLCRRIWNKAGDFRKLRQTRR